MISIAGTYKKGEWAPAFLSGVQVFAVHGAEVGFETLRTDLEVFA